MNETNLYVFHVSDQSKYGKQKTGREIFDFLVKERNAWGFGYHTANRKAIKAGDKVLFYVTGIKNQYFIGSATLKTGAYENTASDSKEWYLDPETLRIDLEDVIIFSEPKYRKDFNALEWQPTQGGSSKMAERDFNIVLGIESDIRLASPLEREDEMEFVLERYLEEFIIGNWDKVDFGERLTVYIDEDGNSGQQYYTGDAGYIDILTKDEKGNFVIIELKKGRKNDEVIGQVLRYIGWVREHLAKNSEEVRGIILVGERDTKLEYALKEISNKVSAKVYRVSFRIEDY